MMAVALVHVILQSNNKSSDLIAVGLGTLEAIEWSKLCNLIAVGLGGVLDWF